tara:strand:- start:419 stop:682 length:264 start_codon:yes stop_codon:yes gene_type:complete
LTKLNIRTKDEIIIKLVSKLEEKHRSVSAESRAVNHGWVLALEWVCGMIDTIVDGKEKSEKGWSVVEEIVDNVQRRVEEKVDGDEKE